MARPRSLRAARNRHTAQFARELEVSTYVRRIASERRELDDIEFRISPAEPSCPRLDIIVNAEPLAGSDKLLGVPVALQLAP